MEHNGYKFIREIGKPNSLFVLTPDINQERDGMQLRKVINASNNKKRKRLMQQKVGGQKVKIQTNTNFPSKPPKYWMKKINQQLVERFEVIDNIEYLTSAWTWACEPFKKQFEEFYNNTIDSLIETAA